MTQLIVRPIDDDRYSIQSQIDYIKLLIEHDEVLATKDINMFVLSQSMQFLTGLAELIVKFIKSHQFRVFADVIMAIASPNTKESLAIQDGSLRDSEK